MISFNSVVYYVIGNGTHRLSLVLLHAHLTLIEMVDVWQRKKFEIRAVGCPESRKFTYYTSSDDKSKHLLYLCRVTHQFSMAMQPKLAELRRLEEEGTCA